MPIVKCSASKATPAKGIAYIMDPEKVIAKGAFNFVSEDPKQMAQQMLNTMHIHQKGFDSVERKYYHVKVAFNPSDRPENGGTLTPQKANDYAAAYAAKTWSGREVVWAVQDHGTSIHIHFIVGACDIETGKKLDARDAEYREWKDRAQVLAKEYGLSTLDWRKATKEKRKREIQKDIPVEETFAEQGLKDRGRSAWKDELRSIIDQAAGSCRSMAEFRTVLSRQGVALTRCSEEVISYKYGDHKACRGDSLGGDYTSAAIRAALGQNARDKAPAMQQNERVESLIQAAAGERKISSEERARYREFGRLAGVTRAEIDALCNQAEKATWEEKQEVWKECQTIRNKHWEEWRRKKQDIDKRLSDTYAERREAKYYDWYLHPGNRRATLWEIIIAFIFFNAHKSVAQLDREIDELKAMQSKLREEAAVFKSKSDEAVTILRQKGLSLGEYVEAVERLQTKSRKHVKDLSAMTKEQRAQYYLEQVNAYL